MNLRKDQQKCNSCQYVVETMGKYMIELADFMLDVFAVSWYNTTVAQGAHKQLWFILPEPRTIFKLLLGQTAKSRPAYFLTLIWN